ncbi:hypothetical protein SAMN02746041_02407 [Desulfacinum hydrothermale DSM 13146]|uniref:Serine aminopeptidase S33 domain-containing protein n=1 Tax=Desulfacinum hydrothermale DSM 13146 TaxID=1121390 RepID=A0A1W1XNU7_9BACT|nr:alpha/beta hydrolase [Desulfacinum hydrothermale]SMC25660.1 hypothetical protein SAMN02746041_02407 [Desulfacinum hydrothermale DSM 13146]
MTWTKLLFFLASGYLLYLFFLFVFQRALIFPTLFVGTPPDLHQPAHLERHWVRTSFGRVETWFLPSRRPGPDGRSPLLVFAHGNGEVIDIWPSVLEPLADRGLGVLLVEYPGYGRSSGKPTQKNITEAFVAAYDMAVVRPDVDSSRIFFWGRSIGGGAVCALAAARPSAGLILMSTFTSLRPFARRYLAPAFLIRDPFDNLDVVRRYPRPVLVVHGKHDTVIPYQHGEELARTATNARLITYDCDHNDCPPRWEPFFRILEEFVTQGRGNPNDIARQPDSRISP